MQSIDLLDTVLLKDGREASIIEVFSDTDFMADVGSSPEDWDTIDITIDNIEKIICKNKE